VLGWAKNDILNVIVDLFSPFESAQYLENQYFGHASPEEGHLYIERTV
jgi:hypothetical protein